MAVNFTFTIVSPKYGTFEVIAPERFRKEIEARTWFVKKDPTRAAGRQFEVGTNEPRGGGNGIRGGGGGYRPLGLHRLVWELAKNPVCRLLDHKDGQPLNNSEDNLRDGTKGNGQNRVSKQRNNTSGVRGVSWIARLNKWLARIGFEGKTIHLGVFSELQEAIECRNAAALKYHGEFAVLARKKDA